MRASSDDGHFGAPFEPALADQAEQLRAGRQHRADGGGARRDDAAVGREHLRSGRAATCCACERRALRVDARLRGLLGGEVLVDLPLAQRAGRLQRCARARRWRRRRRASASASASAARACATSACIDVRREGGAAPGRCLTTSPTLTRTSARRRPSASVPMLASCQAATLPLAASVTGSVARCGWRDDDGQRRLRRRARPSCRRPRVRAGR